MGQYLDANGNQTSDTAKAAKDPKTGKPVPNQARDVWVTYTALSTALNTSYFAETVGVFGLVRGIALLVGIGFLVLVLGGIERTPTTAATPTPAAAKTWAGTRLGATRAVCGPPCRGAGINPPGWA